MLSRGAHPSSTPGTALRDLCPILSLVGACHLPAMRAQESTRATWRVSRLRPLSSRARDGIHEVRATSRRYAPPIPSRDVRASRHPPAALPSPVELGAAASGSQATACVARRSQDTTASSLAGPVAFSIKGSARTATPRSSLHARSLPCRASPCSMASVWATRRTHELRLSVAFGALDRA